MSIVFTNGGAEFAFWATFGIWAIGERILMLRDVRDHGIHYGSKDRGSYYLILLAAGGGIVAAIFLSRVSWLQIPDPVVWLIIGLLLAWGGLVVRFWAIRTLGEFFITKVEVDSDQVVITGGPYRWVRHPSYSGLMLTMVGFGLGMGSIGSLLALAVLPFLGLLPRIRVEEHALEAELGERYIEFEKGRPRLIPHVW